MNKSLKIIIISILSIIIIGLIIFLLIKDRNKNEQEIINNNENTKIIISFSTDGGNQIDNMEVTKGEMFNLPLPVKEGYKFIGWFNENTQYNDEDTSSINSNILLTAHWEKIENKTDSLKITFDTRGGNKIDPITINCTDGSATINNLPIPTKESNSFRTWEDKFNTPILDGALISCEGELNLYAVWD